MASNPLSINRLMRAGWRRCPAPLRAYCVRAISAFLPGVRDVPDDPERPVLVVGGFRETSGIGAGARQYYQEIARSGREAYAVDFSIHPVREPLCPYPVHSPDEMVGVARGGSIIFHVNPPTYLRAFSQCRRLIDGRRVIGFWAWELEDVPPTWKTCIAHVDELECPSTFTAKALRKVTAKDVRVHPHVVPENQVPRRFAEDGIVRVLVVFDFLSTLERKNPQAAVEAFVRAFGDDGKAELIVKTSNTGAADGEGARFLAEVERRPNMRLITERLNAAEYNTLFERSDILLSLHRSEGFGIPILEGMQRGLHVVATAWSGNMDFMAGPKCHFVPYSLIPVERSYLKKFGLKNQQWAEPDVNAAAVILQAVARDGVVGVGA